MVNIVACLCIYNEADFINEVLKHLQWCDRIIIVDGPFHKFPHDSLTSNDGTLSIIEEYTSRGVPIELLGGDRQYRKGDKVKLYQRRVPYGDYILRVDGDEVVQFVDDSDKDDLKWYIEKTKLPVYTLPTHRVLKPSGEIDEPYYIPRLLLNTPTLKITYKHVARTNTFKPKYTVSNYGKVNPPQANLKFIRMLHLTEYRSKERKAKMKQWSVWQYNHGIMFSGV